MKRNLFLAVVLAATLLITGCRINSSSSVPVKTTTGYEPILNRSHFVPAITNPLFPLPVGATWKYSGVKNGHPEIDIMHVTTATKVIEGIRATEVSDISYLNGKVGEKTTDWYAQDEAGNVWYLGEQTAEYLPGGKIDTTGSWQAGINDAEPGIIMPAHPAPPIGYRQEFLAGQAEDTAWTVNTTGSATVPWGSAAPVLTSLEYSRLEPDVIDQKVYAPNIGVIEEKALTGPQEFWVLTSYKP